MRAAIKMTWLFLIFILACERAPSKRVILLGVDALSTDGLQSAKTPNLNRLIKDGALSLKARGVMPTVSAPNWGSMLTGAGPEQHGMTENGWTITNYKIEPTIKDVDGYFPSIFNIIKNKNPELQTAMFYDWRELLDLYNERFIDHKEYLSDYIKVYNRSIEYFHDHFPDFSFIYVGHVDVIGHELRHGSEDYYHSIEEVDKKIGELLNFLDDANLYGSTYIIVISDHGGIGYGHGGVSMAEIQVPWIIKGPGIVKNKLIEEPVNTLNTATTIAYLFNLEPHDHWTGKPVFGAFTDHDASKLNRNSYVPKPRSSVKSGIHKNEQILSFSIDVQGAEIKFTENGKTPDENSNTYSDPINLKESKIIKAAAILNGEISEVTEVNYLKVLNIEKATLISKPSPKYPAELDGKSLIDGELGNDDYTNYAWIGFEVDDFEALIDFGKPKNINKVSLSCLENKNSWIFLPIRVDIFGSNNGVNYIKIGSVESSEIKSDNKRNRINIVKSFSNANYRFLKVSAENIKYCPDDHPSSGGKAWLFVDEIIVE